MSGHGARGAVLEYEATVDEIKDNMKSILGKVIFVIVESQILLIFFGRQLYVLNTFLEKDFID